MLHFNLSSLETETLKTFNIKNLPFIDSISFQQPQNQTILAEYFIECHLFVSSSYAGPFKVLNFATHCEGINRSEATPHKD